MNEKTSSIKPSDLYSDLTETEIAEMMAEAAKVDALFQSGQISTLFFRDLTVAVREASEVPELEADASAEAA